MRNEKNLKVAATKEDIYSLKEDLSRTEAKLTMRMFLFSVGQVLTIITALIAIIHFMVK